MSSRNHINNFPTEILQETFLYVVSHAKDTSWDYGNADSINFSSALSLTPFIANYRSPASPYSISHVCRRWRDIGLSFPNLWTHLCVVKPKTVSGALIAQQWLDRAGSMPLYLFLNHEGPDNDFGTKAVLKSFIRHLHKWKSFQMETQTGLNTLVEPDVVQMLTIAPALEHLSFTCYGITGAALVAPLLNILSQSPALRSVMLVSDSTPIQFPYLWAPKWANITVLKLRTEDYHLEELLDGISYCKNLQRLGLYGMIINWEPAATAKQLVLPHLTHLSVPANPSIITWLTLPSISTLDLTMTWNSQWWSVTGLIDRSRASLKVLKVFDPVDCFFQEQEFIMSLRSPYFQQLKVLEVTCPLTMETMEFLTLPAKQLGSEPQSGFLPHLERLSLALKGPLLGEHHRKIQQLIKSRLGASSSVTTHSCLRPVMEGLCFTLDIPHVE